MNRVAIAFVLTLSLLAAISAPMSTEVAEDALLQNKGRAMLIAVCEGAGELGFLLDSRAIILDSRAIRLDSKATMLSFGHQKTEAPGLPYENISIVLDAVHEAIDEPGLPLEGRVVVLDAGHGSGNSPGYSGYIEHSTMLTLALKIQPLLEAQGATVYLTRDDMWDVPLSGRAALINLVSLEAIREARMTNQPESHALSEEIAEIDRLIQLMQSIRDNPWNGEIYMNAPFDPDRRIHPELVKVFELQDDPVIANRFLSISLHSNATGLPINTSVNGASAYYISTSHRNTPNYYTGFTYTWQSQRFATIILDHVSAVGFRNRGAMVGNYFLIREHNVPGVLVENGFHTNTRDRNNLQDDRFLNRLAAAYVDAIIVYFSELPLDAVLPMTYQTDAPSLEWGEIVRLLIARRQGTDSQIPMSPPLPGGQVR